MTDTPQQAPAPSPTGLPCPVCRVDLVMSERQGIEIDYCPKCRGVWLDRGELDKIIERAAAEQLATPSFLGGVAPQQGGSFLPQQPPARFLPDQGGPGPWGGQHHGRDDDHERGRGSFLSRLFDD